MSQFDVYRNRSPATRELYPLLLDIQADLLADLRTRVVIPLTQAHQLMKRPLAILMPIIRIAAEEYVLATPELAAIAKPALGARVANIDGQRDTIISALDLLVTGA
jgi:toxin CcdB